MVEVEVDIDLSRLDPRQEQIEHDAATRGGDVELARGRPLAEFLTARRCARIRTDSAGASNWVVWSCR